MLEPWVDLVHSEATSGRRPVGAGGRWSWVGVPLWLVNSHLGVAMQKRSLSSCQRGFDSVSRSSTIFYPFIHPPRPSPAARRRTSLAGAASIHPPPSVCHGRPPRPPPSTVGAARRTSGMAVSIRRGRLPSPAAAHLPRELPPYIRLHPSATAVRHGRLVGIRVD